MKLLNVIGPSGEKLFTGTKRDCKMFIRANKLSRYTLKGTFVEKVATAPAAFTPEVKKTEPDVWFNEIFEEDE